MFAQCPECMTVFALDAHALSRANGLVGCSQCGATFDTLATLCDQLPEEPFETLPINEPGSAPPLLLQAIEHRRPPQQALFPPDVDTAATGIGTSPSAGIPEREPRPAPADLPAFARQATTAARQGRRSTRLLIAACAVLAVALAMQLAWAERASLVRLPAVASAVQTVCGSLGCRLPMARDPARLELGSRDIRRHPSVDGALLISATIRNTASFSQPWPVIGITLSDLDDQRVAMRRFRPAEYLRDAAIRRGGLAPGTTAALVFEVADPGRDAVAFEFVFQ